MKKNVIDVQGATRHFGAIKAVEEVSFTVSAGELFGLIGHNGAGKSTLFKMMLGLIAPTSGEILLCGQKVSGQAFRAVRRTVGYLPENVVLYDNLTGEETLAFFAQLKGVHNPKQCTQLLAQVGLEQAGKRRVREYSKGMRQRLAFAQALLGQPQLLLLDEPTNGLDPEGIHEFYLALSQVCAAGTTVILTSHILAEIEQRVDRLALMSAGKLAALGTVAELSAKIDLPVAVQLVFSELAYQAQAQALLLKAGFAAQASQKELHLSVAHRDKARLLPVLAQLSEGLADVRFIEPSLEALFLAHRHAKL